MANPEIKNPPDFYLRTPFKIRAKWEAQYTTKFLLEPVPLPVTVFIESFDETVTVLAGTFKNCMKVSKKGSKIGFNTIDIGLPKMA